MKFLSITVLIAFAVCINGNEEEETAARLLISKQILNKYLVEDMDIVVKVCTVIVLCCSIIWEI
jgi:translocon-associated protein subunit beta